MAGGPRGSRTEVKGAPSKTKSFWDDYQLLPTLEEFKQSSGSQANLLAAEKSLVGRGNAAAKAAHTALPAADIQKSQVAYLWRSPSPKHLLIQGYPPFPDGKPVLVNWETGIICRDYIAQSPDGSTTVRYENFMEVNPHTKAKVPFKIDSFVKKLGIHFLQMDSRGQPQKTPPQVIPPAEFIQHFQTVFNPQASLSQTAPLPPKSSGGAPPMSPLGGGGRGPAIPHTTPIRGGAPIAPHAVAARVEVSEGEELKESEEKKEAGVNLTDEERREAERQRLGQDYQELSPAEQSAVDYILALQQQHGWIFERMVHREKLKKGELTHKLVALTDKTKEEVQPTLDKIKEEFAKDSNPCQGSFIEHHSARHRQTIELEGELIITEKVRDYINDLNLFNSPQKDVKTTQRRRASQPEYEVTIDGSENDIKANIKIALSGKGFNKGDKKKIKAILAGIEARGCITYQDMLRCLVANKPDEDSTDAYKTAYALVLNLVQMQQNVGLSLKLELLETKLESMRDEIWQMTLRGWETILRRSVYENICRYVTDVIKQPPQLLSKQDREAHIAAFKAQVEKWKEGDLLHAKKNLFNVAGQVVPVNRGEIEAGLRSVLDQEWYNFIEDNDGSAFFFQELQDSPQEVLRAAEAEVAKLTKMDEELTNQRFDFVGGPYFVAEEQLKGFHFRYRKSDFKSDEKKSKGKPGKSASTTQPKDVKSAQSKPAQLRIIRNDERRNTLACLQKPPQAAGEKEILVTCQQFQEYLQALAASAGIHGLEVGFAEDAAKGSHPAHPPTMIFIQMPPQLAAEFQKEITLPIFNNSLLEGMVFDYQRGQSGILYLPITRFSFAYGFIGRILREQQPKDLRAQEAGSGPQPAPSSASGAPAAASAASSTSRLSQLRPEVKLTPEQIQQKINQKIEKLKQDANNHIKNPDNDSLNISKKTKPDDLEPWWGYGDNLGMATPLSQLYAVNYRLLRIRHDIPTRKTSPQAAFELFAECIEKTHEFLARLDVASLDEREANILHAEFTQLFNNLEMQSKDLELLVPEQENLEELQTQIKILQQVAAGKKVEVREVEEERDDQEEEKLEERSERKEGKREARAPASTKALTNLTALVRKKQQLVLPQIIKPVWHYPEPAGIKTVVASLSPLLSLIGFSSEPNTLTLFKALYGLGPLPASDGKQLLDTFNSLLGIDKFLDAYAKWLIGPPSRSLYGEPKDDPQSHRELAKLMLYRLFTDNTQLMAKLGGFQQVGERNLIEELNHDLLAIKYGFENYYKKEINNPDEQKQRDVQPAVGAAGSAAVPPPAAPARPVAPSSAPYGASVGGASHAAADGSDDEPDDEEEYARQLEREAEENFQQIKHHVTGCITYCYANGGRIIDGSGRQLDQAAAIQHMVSYAAKYKNVPVEVFIQAIAGYFYDNPQKMGVKKSLTLQCLCLEYLLKLEIHPRLRSSINYALARAHAGFIDSNFPKNNQKVVECLATAYVSATGKAANMVVDNMEDFFRRHPDQRECTCIDDRGRNFKLSRDIYNQVMARIAQLQHPDAEISIAAAMEELKMAASQPELEEDPSRLQTAVTAELKKAGAAEAAAPEAPPVPPSSAPIATAAPPAAPSPAPNSAPAASAAQQPASSAPPSDSESIKEFIKQVIENCMRNYPAGKILKGDEETLNRQQLTGKLIDFFCKEINSRENLDVLLAEMAWKLSQNFSRYVALAWREFPYDISEFRDIEKSFRNYVFAQVMQGVPISNPILRSLTEMYAQEKNKVAVVKLLVVAYRNRDAKALKIVKEIRRVGFSNFHEITLRPDDLSLLLAEQSLGEKPLENNPLFRPSYTSSSVHSRVSIIEDDKDALDLPIPATLSPAPSSASVGGPAAPATAAPVAAPDPVIKDAVQGAEEQKERKSELKQEMVEGVGTGKRYGIFPSPADIKADQTVVRTDHVPVTFEEENGAPLFDDIRPLSVNVMSPGASDTYKPEYTGDAEDQQGDGFNGARSRAARVAKSIVNAVKEGKLNLIALQEIDSPNDKGQGIFGKEWLENLQNELFKATGQQWNLVPHPQFGLATLCRADLGQIGNAKPGERQLTCTITPTGKPPIEVTNVHWDHMVSNTDKAKTLSHLLASGNAMVLGDLNSRVRAAAIPRKGLMINGLVQVGHVPEHDEYPREVGCDSTDALFYRRNYGPIRQAVRVQLDFVSGKRLGLFVLDKKSMSPRQLYELTRPREFFDADERVSGEKLLQTQGGHSFTCAEYQKLLQDRRKYLKNEKIKFQFAVSFADNMGGDHENDGKPNLVAICMPPNFYKAFLAKVDMFVPNAQQLGVEFYREKNNTDAPGMVYVPVTVFPQLETYINEVYSDQINKSDRQFEQDRTELLRRAKAINSGAEGVPDEGESALKDERGVVALLSKLWLINEKLDRYVKRPSQQGQNDKNLLAQRIHKFSQHVISVRNLLRDLIDIEVVLETAEIAEVYAEFAQLVDNLDRVAKDLDVLLRRTSGSSEDNKTTIRDLQREIAQWQEVMSRSKKPDAKASKETIKGPTIINLEALVSATREPKSAKLVERIDRLSPKIIAPGVIESLPSSLFGESAAVSLFKALHQFAPLPPSLKDKDIVAALKILLANKTYLDWIIQNPPPKPHGIAKDTAEARYALARVEVCKLFQKIGLLNRLKKPKEFLDVLSQEMRIFQEKHEIVADQKQQRASVQSDPSKRSPSSPGAPSSAPMAAGAATPAAASSQGDNNADVVIALDMDETLYRHAIYGMNNPVLQKVLEICQKAKREDKRVKIALVSGRAPTKEEILGYFSVEAWLTQGAGRGGEPSPVFAKLGQIKKDKRSWKSGGLFANPVINNEKILEVTDKEISTLIHGAKFTEVRKYLCEYLDKNGIKDFSEHGVPIFLRYTPHDPKAVEKATRLEDALAELTVAQCYERMGYLESFWHYPMQKKELIIRIQNVEKSLTFLYSSIELEDRATKERDPNKMSIKEFSQWMQELREKAAAYSAAEVARIKEKEKEKEKELEEKAPKPSEGSREHLATQGKNPNLIQVVDKYAKKKGLIELPYMDDDQKYFPLLMNYFKDSRVTVIPLHVRGDKVDVFKPKEYKKFEYKEEGEVVAEDTSPRGQTIAQVKPSAPNSAAASPATVVPSSPVKAAVAEAKQEMGARELAVMQAITNCIAYCEQQGGVPVVLAETLRQAAVKKRTGSAAQIIKMNLGDRLLIRIDKTAQTKAKLTDENWSLESPQAIVKELAMAFRNISDRQDYPLIQSADENSQLAAFCYEYWLSMPENNAAPEDKANVALLLARSYAGEKLRIIDGLSVNREKALKYIRLAKSHSSEVVKNTLAEIAQSGKFGDLPNVAQELGLAKPDSKVEAKVERQLTNYEIIDGIIRQCMQDYPDVGPGEKEALIKKIVDFYDALQLKNERVSAEFCAEMAFALAGNFASHYVREFGLETPVDSVVALRFLEYAMQAKVGDQEFCNQTAAYALAEYHAGGPAFGILKLDAEQVNKEKVVEIFKLAPNAMSYGSISFGPKNPKKQFHKIELTATDFAQQEVSEAKADSKARAPSRAEQLQQPESPAAPKAAEPVAAAVPVPSEAPASVAVQAPSLTPAFKAEPKELSERPVSSLDAKNISPQQQKRRKALFVFDVDGTLTGIAGRQLFKDNPTPKGKGKTKESHLIDLAEQRKFDNLISSGVIGMLTDLLDADQDADVVFLTGNFAEFIKYMMVRVGRDGKKLSEAQWKRIKVYDQTHPQMDTGDEAERTNIISQLVNDGNYSSAIYFEDLSPGKEKIPEDKYLSDLGQELSKSTPPVIFSFHTAKSGGFGWQPDGAHYRLVRERLTAVKESKADSPISAPAAEPVAAAAPVPPEAPASAAVSVAASAPQVPPPSVAASAVNPAASPAPLSEAERASADQQQQAEYYFSLAGGQAAFLLLKNHGGGPSYTRKDVIDSLKSAIKYGHKKAFALQLELQVKGQFKLIGITLLKDELGEIPIKDEEIGPLMYQLAIAYAGANSFSASFRGKFYPVMAPEDPDGNAEPDLEKVKEFLKLAYKRGNEQAKEFINLFNKEGLQEQFIEGVCLEKSWFTDILPVPSPGEAKVKVPGASSGSLYGSSAKSKPEAKEEAPAPTPQPVVAESKAQPAPETPARQMTASEKKIEAMLKECMKFCQRQGGIFSIDGVNDEAAVQKVMERVRSHMQQQGKLDNDAAWGSLGYEVIADLAKQLSGYKDLGITTLQGMEANLSLACLCFEYLIEKDDNLKIPKTDILNFASITSKAYRGEEINGAKIQINPRKAIKYLKKAAIATFSSPERDWVLNIQQFFKPESAGQYTLAPGCVIDRYDFREETRPQPKAEVQQPTKPPEVKLKQQQPTPAASPQAPASVAASAVNPAASLAPLSEAERAYRAKQQQEQDLRSDFDTAVGLSKSILLPGYGPFQQRQDVIHHLNKAIAKGYGKALALRLELQIMGKCRFGDIELGRGELGEITSPIKDEEIGPLAYAFAKAYAGASSFNTSFRGQYYQVMAPQDREGRLTNSPSKVIEFLKLAYKHKNELAMGFINRFNKKESQRFVNTIDLEKSKFIDILPVPSPDEAKVQAPGPVSGSWFSKSEDKSAMVDIKEALAEIITKLVRDHYSWDTDEARQTLKAEMIRDSADRIEQGMSKGDILFMYANASYGADDETLEKAGLYVDPDFALLLLDEAVKAGNQQARSLRENGGEIGGHNIPKKSQQSDAPGGPS